MSTVRSEAHLQHSLNEVTRLLEKHRVLEAMTRRELRRRDLLETLQHRQNLAELQKRVRALHAADVADILGRGPAHGLAADRAGHDRHRVSGGLACRSRVARAGPPRAELVRMLATRDSESCPLQRPLLWDPMSPIARAVEPSISFGPHDHAGDAVKAFERYDLVSAPVLDDRGKLVGRLTVDAAMDALRQEAGLEALKRAGLTGDEDLFGAPWASARNPWPWLGVNLLTAFVASRVIGQFEGTIAQLSALAALMPIVASIGGNTGNQTMTLVIRAIATDRIQPASAPRLVRKELLVSLLNGSLWGIVVGLAAIMLYSNPALGLVMSAAVVLNLVVAALATAFLMP